MKAIWEKTVKREEFKSLSGDLKTDVLVIGGGMAGILCADLLKKAGVECALIEADRIFSGVSGGTTAKITLQHSLIYQKLISRFGSEYARLYLLAQREALQKYTETCESIDCDFRTCDSYVYSRRDREVLERERDALASLGCRSVIKEDTELPFSVVGALRLGGQACFDPLKFAYSLARSLEIYEKTKALKILKDGVLTDRGVIRAKKIIVATHFPFVNSHGAYFIKMYQSRSYVLALKGVPAMRGIYLDEAQNGLSFRSVGECLLLGGGAHRTGKEGGGWNELSKAADIYYRNTLEVGRWATQDCMTLDGVPYIGKYYPASENVYVATGFNKWGMSGSMVSALILRDMILGRKNEYAKIFSPSRSILHPQLLVNVGESLAGFLRLVPPRCSHLGCSLVYNREEHSWDCPCHGSRFSADGELYDGPAQTDIEIKKQKKRRK